MLAKIRRNFVPVALNLYTIREAKGPAGDFFRAVQKQTPELYQGLYVVQPDTKVLATHGKALDPVAKWTQAVHAMLDEALRLTGPLPARTETNGDVDRSRGRGLDKDGNAILAVYTRPMVLGLDRRGLGDHAVDSVRFTKADLAAFSLPVDPKVGLTWKIPADTVRKLHKVLSPNSDANTLARADEVVDATLKARIVRLTDRVAHLRIDGHISGIHTWQFDPNKGKKIRAAVGLLGVARVDTQTGQLLGFTLVGEGLYSHFPPYDEASKYGAVVEWQRD